MLVLTPMLNGLFLVLGFIGSIKQKKYRYTWYITFTLIYFVLVYFQSNYDLTDTASVFGSMQRLVLLLLAVLTASAARKPFDKKSDVFVAVCAGIACVFRFARTIIFNYYIENMRITASKLATKPEVGYIVYILADPIIKIALFLMLLRITSYLFTPQNNDC